MKRNYKSTINCLICSKAVIKTSSFQKYCKTCSIAFRREYKRKQERIRMSKPGKKEHLRKIQKIWIKNNAARLRTKGQRLRAEFRLTILNMYGGRCACCGITEPKFLAIDHINGGGNKHRKTLGSKGGASFYSWLKRNNYPTGFQVLCHNCNMAKGFYGQCPHQEA